MADGSGDLVQNQTSLWRTADVTPTERFDYYREAICQAFMNLAPARPINGRTDFQADVQSTPIADGALNVVASDAHQVDRSRAEIASSDAACFYLNLILHGDCTVRQAGQEVTFSRSTVGLFASDLPFTLHHEVADKLKVASFWVPQAALETRLPGGLPGGPQIVSDDPVIGRLVGEIASSLAGNIETLTTGEAGKLFGMLLDSVALQISSSASARVDRQGLFSNGLYLAATRFISAHIHDPMLSASGVARQLGISRRYLHKLFEQNENTFSEHIMALRLDGAARDLRDLAKRHVSILEIAINWGFRDHSHFSRRFRQRFQMSPRDWRHTAYGG
jgi:AraC-like DNA-binding protein